MDARLLEVFQEQVLLQCQYTIYAEPHPISWTPYSL